MSAERTVADVMVTRPYVLPASTDVVALRFLADDHVHAALIVDATGRLMSVIERADLAASRLATSRAAAAAAGTLVGRTVRPDEPVSLLRPAMIASGRRRLAVVDDDGRLRGLLCLKRDGSGFCSDADVTARQCGPRDPLAV